MGENNYQKGDCVVSNAEMGWEGRDALSTIDGNQEVGKRLPARRRLNVLRVAGWWSDGLALLVLAAVLLVALQTARAALAIKMLTPERIAELCAASDACASGELRLSRVQGSRFAAVASADQIELNIQAGPKTWDASRFLSALGSLERFCLGTPAFVVSPAARALRRPSGSK
jgi:hypothetical protein